KRAYCLKTQPATGETYPKSDLFNKALRFPQQEALHYRHIQMYFRQSCFFAHFNMVVFIIL
ncbi:hypothetical protein, partial [Klebsiella pneumoniae]|uniref:hypothetical protein n=1 Tax=Klebsiella pneumoniae TaxID=573 RepID=UPI0021BFD9C8